MINDPPYYTDSTFKDYSPVKVRILSTAVVKIPAFKDPENDVKL